LNLVVLFFEGLKLEKDFYNIQKDKFNISKVPDIYDTIKYDLLHNKNMQQFPHAEDLYVCSKALADLVVPQVKEILTLQFHF
jgi:inositol hexakisphosphate/diphosphoinositol-pentakisphosphate kinase